MNALTPWIAIAIAATAALAQNSEAATALDIQCKDVREVSESLNPLKEVSVVIPPIGDPSAFVVSGIGTLQESPIDQFTVARDRSKIEVKFNGGKSVLNIKPTRRHGQHRIMKYIGTFALNESQRYALSCRVRF